MSRLNHAIKIFIFLGLALQVLSACCPASEESAFCELFNQLNPEEQHEIQETLGENCGKNPDEALKVMEKRKPNFIRFGRSGKLKLSVFVILLVFRTN